MGEDREGHPVWYGNFNYDFRGKYILVIKTYFTLRYSTFNCMIYTPMYIFLYRVTLFSEDRGCLGSSHVSC